MKPRNSIKKEHMHVVPHAEVIPLAVLYEDDAILIVNKPAGMFVHPSPGHLTGTLVNALLAYCPSIAGVGSVERPGIVHRLDQETSGAMVVAKTARAYGALRQAFESHTSVTKTYLAILHGAPSPRAGVLENQIGRKPWDPKRMAVVDVGGQRAVTHWRMLAKHGALALVEFKIETGRMHQIRVHAAALGHPVVGDSLYGDAQADRRVSVHPKRALLHAVELRFSHPITGAQIDIIAPPPADIVFV